MSFEKYFDEVREFANNNFHSFDGNFEFSNDDDYGFSDYEDADGLGGTIDAPTSQPYIVNVQNTNTSSNIANVTILGAYTFIGTAAPQFGNTTTFGISISMGIANISYQEFLYQSMNKPFTVGLTYISSATAAQVLETLTITQKDVNGNVASKVLTPTIDPYQFQTDKVAFKFEYRIDGFTNMVISSVLAATTLKLYFYPSETVATSRALAGRRAVQNYGNPRVVNGNVVRIAPPRSRGGLASGPRLR
jgi:hypothetical protein